MPSGHCRRQNASLIDFVFACMFGEAVREATQGAVGISVLELWAAKLIDEDLCQRT